MNAETVVSLSQVFCSRERRSGCRKGRAGGVKSWGRPRLRAQQQVMEKATSTPAFDSSTHVPPEKGLTPSSGLHSYLVVIII